MRAVNASRAVFKSFTSSVGLPNTAPRKFAPRRANAVCRLPMVPSMVSPADLANPEACSSTVLSRSSRPTCPLEIILAISSPDLPIVSASQDWIGRSRSWLVSSSIDTLPVLAIFKKASPMLSMSAPANPAASDTSVINRFRSPVFDDRARVAIPNALSNAYGVPSTTSLTVFIACSTLMVALPVDSRTRLRFFSRFVAASIDLYRSKPLNSVYPAAPIRPAAAVVNARPSARPASAPTFPAAPS